MFDVILKLLFVVILLFKNVIIFIFFDFKCFIGFLRIFEKMYFVVEMLNGKILYMKYEILLFFFYEKFKYCWCFL